MLLTNGSGNGHTLEPDKKDEKCKPGRQGRECRRNKPRVSRQYKGTKTNNNTKSARKALKFINVAWSPTKQMVLAMGIRWSRIRRTKSASQVGRAASAEETSGDTGYRTLLIVKAKSLKAI
jgi:hypothetical protein